MRLSKKAIKSFVSRIKYLDGGDTVVFGFVDGFGDRARLIVTRTLTGRYRVDYRGPGRWDEPDYFNTIDAVVDNLHRNGVDEVLLVDIVSEGR